MTERIRSPGGRATPTGCLRRSEWSWGPGRTLPPQRPLRIYRTLEWDARKARANDEKHGVTFDEAAGAFDDPRGLDGVDLRHSATEARRLRLAMSGAGRILVVAYTLRGHAVRLI